MKTKQSIGTRPGRRVGGVACAIVLLVFGTGGLFAADSLTATKTAEPEPGEYANSITIGAGNYWVNDDKAAFRQSRQMPAGAFGGIEEIHFEQAIAKQGLFQLDGHGIFDNHDYSLQLSVSHPDIGSLRAGFQEFRTWYDGSGGYSPLSNRWVSVYNDTLAMDRRSMWVEGKLTLPDWPVFSVRYSVDTRDGRKDSTSWGDISLSGNTANLRAIVPTFLDIDEHRHTVNADVDHTIGNTKFNVGMTYQRDDIYNSRNIRRRPGDPARDRYLTQVDDSSSDMLSAHAAAETRFNSKVMVSYAGAYTRLDTDIGGSRIYGPNYSSPFNPISFNQQANDEGFIDLAGGSLVDQYVANLNLFLTPWKHWAIVPALRFEHQDQSGVAMFTETAVTNAAKPALLQNILNERMRKFTDVTESLSLRYTGFTNWSLYARAEWLQGQGRSEESEFDIEDEGTPLVSLQRVTDSERYIQKYVLGANWYPCRKANFAAQYYYKLVENSYDFLSDSTKYDPPPAPVNTNNLYPSFIREQNFQTHDVNLRMTLRPLANVTLVTRYDYTITHYDMRGDIDSYGKTLAGIEGAKATAHILSQSVSWTPLPQLYLQGSISYALQRTESPVADIQTGTASNLVQNAENDYWNASATVGWAFTKISDLQATYFYYRANNYDPANAAVGLPYGATAEQHGATLTLLNRVRRNMLWKIQYGYFAGHDGTSGGRNDYAAHLVYSSWQFLF